MTHGSARSRAWAPLAAFLAGCGIAGDEASDEPHAWLEREGSASEDARARACDPAVQIAYRADADGCDDVGAWHGRSLFDAGTPWLDGHDPSAVPSALGRFCELTWGGGGQPQPSHVAGLVAALGGDPVAPSCQAMAPQADALSDALATSLRALLRWSSGRPSSSDLALPATGTTDPRVTVLVVDTQPHDGEQPTSNHGRWMGNIIADIACPGDDPSCRTEVIYTVGLPRHGGLRDYERGGRVGTHADLALGIYEGLRRWEQDNATRATPSKLVVSLSVGWEPEVFGGLESAPEPAIRAIRDVLELASCKGAVIVASVGNDGDFCGATGPMLPAAWEARPAPGVARCDELGVAISTPPGGYRPLVHAVGGLGLDHGPLPRARPSADPRLMAASAHAFAGNPVRGGVTGTSVGTAVAAGAAALVWSYRPALHSSTVMGWVYAGAKPLPGVGVDFGLAGTTPGSARRVDACAALDAACDAPSASCPTLPLGCLTATAPAESTLDTALAAASPVTDVVRTLPVVDGSCVDSCGEPVAIHVQSGQSAYCDALAIDPVEQLVNPTPDSIGCPTCTIQGETLLMSVHEDLDGLLIEDVLVTLTDDLGNMKRYDLGALALSSTTVTRVALDPAQLPPGAIKGGEITLVLPEIQARTTDPLLVR